MRRRLVCDARLFPCGSAAAAWLDEFQHVPDMPAVLLRAATTRECACERGPNGTKTALRFAGGRLMIVPELVVTLSLFLMGPQQPAAPQTVQSSVSRSFTGVLMDTQNTSCGPQVEKAVPKGACPASFRTTSFGLALPSG